MWVLSQYINFHVKKQWQIGKLILWYGAVEHLDHQRISIQILVLLIQSGLVLDLLGTMLMHNSVRVVELLEYRARWRLNPFTNQLSYGLQFCERSRN